MKKRTIARTRHCAVSIVVLASALAVLGLNAYAEDFGNNWDRCWADTPKGRFECVYANSLQLLTLGGGVLYRESPDDFLRERADRLTSGISNENIGCPRIIANREGHVVIVRDTQPPHYGIEGYAVLDFNASPPTITELAEGQRPKDEAIADARRITWTPTGLTLSYFGYPRAQPGGSIDSPKPRAHEVGFDFESRNVKQLK